MKSRFRICKFSENHVEMDECELSEIVSRLSDALNGGYGFWVVQIKK